MNILTQAADQLKQPTMQTMAAPAPAPAAAPAAPAPAPAPSAATSFDVNGAAGPMKGPTEMKVTDNMLASKQLDSILSRDNPLMEKARARAQMAANRRGLLNSSMAVNAGQSAMVDAALPLAQQDASTQFQAGQYNASTANDFARDDNRFGRDVAMARFGAVVGQEDKAADRSHQAGQNLLERQHQVSMQQMGQQFQMDFEKFRLPMNMMTSFTDKMQDYVNQVMRDPNMDAAAKNQAIANYYSYSQQQMGWMSTFFGQPMPSMSGGGNIQPGSATAPPNYDFSASTGGAGSTATNTQRAYNESRGLPPDFDTQAYLAANPDVAAAVNAGKMTAEEHYLRWGVNEAWRSGSWAPRTTAPAPAPAASPSPSPNVGIPVAGQPTGPVPAVQWRGVDPTQGVGPTLTRSPLDPNFGLLR